MPAREEFEKDLIGIATGFISLKLFYSFVDRWAPKEIDDLYIELSELAKERNKLFDDHFLFLKFKKKKRLKELEKQLDVLELKIYELQNVQT